ncbi:roadblock/LC7 domain-containing protein [Persephonella sp.]
MDRFQSILQSIINNTGADGAILISPDGLAVSSTFREGQDEDRIAAMGAAILSLGERVNTELQKGELEQLYVKGSHGYILFTGIDNLAVLGVTTSGNVKLGLILMEVKRAVEKFKEVM